MKAQDGFKKGTAAMVVLHLLCEKDCYVYQITQEVSRLSEKRFTLQEGSLYPTLYKLQENGYVTERVVIAEENQRLRKYYSITDKGREYLKELIEDYKTIIKGIELIMSYNTGDDRNE